MEKVKIDKIIRSRRRTIALEIATDASLIVRAPIHASNDIIMNFVERKVAWIIEKQELIKRKAQNIISKKFVDGEEFLFLGKYFQLIISQERRASLLFNNLNFIISKKYLGRAKEQFIKWYKKAAYEKFLERTNYYSSLYGIKYNKIKLSSAEKRWGSCSPLENINLNWRLIMAPAEIIDYVIVHELVHVVERNHSKRFWNKVKIILPGYKSAKNWLKENGNLLMI